MERHYLFADESGNLDFSRQRGATRFFTVGTIHIVGDDAVESLRTDLLKLQTELGWLGLAECDGFHASEDSQAVRDAVYGVLRPHGMTGDATLIEKPRVDPRLRITSDAFVRHAWERHFDSLSPLMRHDRELLVVMASVGTRKSRKAFRESLADVVKRAAWEVEPQIMFTRSNADPALQAADYVIWAIARAVERGDDRALGAVMGKIRSRTDLYAGDGVLHY